MQLYRIGATLAVASLLSGCLASMGGGTAPSDSGVATGAADASAGAYKAPPSDIAVDAIRPEHLSTGKVLIVPSAYVRLAVAGKVAVANQGSALRTIGGGNANSVKASARFTVQGIDKALAQKIAAAAYDDFVAQLRAAGYTVLTYADIKDRDVVKEASRMKPDSEWGMPTEKIQGGTVTALLATPSDEQAFEFGLAGGVFNQFIRLGKTKLEDGIIIIPTYTITAPQMWGEKSSTYATIGAAVKGAPAMVLTNASAFWLTNKPKVEIMNGIPGVHLKGFAGLSDKVGELQLMEDTTSGAANAISAGLSFLTGAGRITSKSATYAMTVDRDAYVAAATDGLRKFNKEVGRIAAQQKP